jgi:hypothetical protein
MLPAEDENDLLRTPYVRPHPEVQLGVLAAEMLDPRIGLEARRQ